jgi:peroxiredoxin (alkyl hydroperoxide reductase subunit C)
VDALQATDAHKIATPANWRPGERVIIPTTTVEFVDERLSEEFASATEGYECIDWYLCKKSVKRT